MKIVDLRKEMGLSLEAFADRIGLQSKGRMSIIERENSCSLAVALRIEALSGGRIDAADLSEDVHAARLAIVDSADNAAAQHDASTGQAAKMSGREV